VHARTRRERALPRGEGELREVKRALVAFCSFVVLVLSARAAWAHGTGVSKADYAIDANVVHATIVFRREELKLAFGDHPEADVARSIIVSSDGAPCVAGPAKLDDDPPDGARVSFDLECPRPPSRLHVTSGYLDRFPIGHTSFVTATRGFQKTEAVALLAQPEVDLDVRVQQKPFFAIVKVGIGHILTGYDHLTFLLALLLVPAPEPDKRKKLLWALLGVLTAFTLGHTLSLAIASLSGIAPSPRIVEPAIALSIAYVAAENFLVKSWRHRWLLTFPFGLVHGFGFASGLLDLAVDQADLPRALFAFNVGVEVGQLAVLAVVLPAVLWAQRLARYTTLRRVLSGLIIALGLMWFVLRIVVGP
jgi:hydrogenase/urease accessory protein HupE